MKKTIKTIGAIMAILAMAMPILAFAQTIPGRLVKSTSDPTVYVLAVNGTKRPVFSQEMLNSLGLSSTAVRVVSQTTLNSYLRTQVVKSPSSTAIYRLNEDMTKQVIATWQTYLEMGFKPRDIVTVSQAELDMYANGPVITNASGRNTEFELALSMKSQNALAQTMASSVNIGSLGSAWSSRTNTEAANFLVGQFSNAGQFTFVSVKDIAKQTGSTSFMARMAMQQYRDYVVGYSNANQQGDRAGIAYHVNSNGQVDKVLYAPSLCAIAAPFYQCQR